MMSRSSRVFFFFALLLFSVLILLVACDSGVQPNPQSDSQHLKLVSNVDEIQNAKDSKKKGDKIVGVQIVFHSGSGESVTGAFSINDPECFYLEALGETKKASDGRKYNYILYVPEILRSTFTKGGGAFPKTGNPFWWYNSKYCKGKRGDWDNILSYLLANKDKLDYPESSDVNENWKPIDEKTDKNFFIQPRYFSYDPVNNTSYSGDETFSKVFKYYYIEDKEMHMVCYPHSIYMAYVLGGGTGNDSPDTAYREAFYWYLKKYFNITKDDLCKEIEKGADSFQAYLDNLTANMHTPLSSDVPEGNKVAVNAQIKGYDDAVNLELRYVYFYKEGQIVLEDGTPVPDNERAYIRTADWNNNRHVCWIFLPYSYLESYEANAEKWDGTHHIFRDYLVYKGILEESHKDVYNYEFPVSLLNNLFTPFQDEPTN